VSVNIPFGKKRQIEQGQKKDSAVSSDGKFLKAVSESENSKEELVKESPVNSESKFLKVVSESEDIKEELEMDSAAISKSKFTKAVSESEDSKEEVEMESADNSEGEFLKAVSEFEDSTEELEKNDETEDIEDLADQTREKKNWRGGVTGRVRNQGGRKHGSIGVQGRYRFGNGARVSVQGSVGTHGHGAGVSVNIPFGKKRQIEQEQKKESPVNSDYSCCTPGPAGCTRMAEVLNKCNGRMNLVKASCRMITDRVNCQFDPTTGSLTCTSIHAHDLKCCDFSCDM